MKIQSVLRSVIASVALVGSMFSVAQAADIGTLTPGQILVGVDTNNKPYSYIDGGKVTGFDVELIRAIAAKRGMTAEFRAQDFSGLLPSVASRQIDLAAGCISITNDRLKIVDFSDGYVFDYLSVATLPGTTLTSDVASVKGKRIGVIQGTIEDTYWEKYLPGAQIVRFPNLTAGLLAFRNKYIDGYFVDKSLVDGLEAKYPQLKITTKIDISALDQPAGFPIRKGNKQLEDALNATLKELIADGTWMKLYMQFHPGYKQPSPLPPYHLKTGS